MDTHAVTFSAPLEPGAVPEPSTSPIHLASPDQPSFLDPYSRTVASDIHDHEHAPVLPTAAVTEHDTLRAATVNKDAHSVTSQPVYSSGPNNQLNPEDILGPGSSAKLSADSKQPKLRPSWRLWLLEIALCYFGLCSFTTIVAVLAAYNGKALPNFPMNITLNTFIAFFSTFTKLSFMVPISEALSQWKWNQFASADHLVRGAPLHDFEVLDIASRGTWGSLLLLGSLKWRRFVSLAAVLSITSILTSPLTQQMISYPTREAPISGIATVPFTTKFQTIPMSLGRDLLQATQSDPEATILPLPANCSSATCNYPQFSSLAMCSKIRDISNLLTVTKIENSTTADWSGPGKDVWDQSKLSKEFGNRTTAWNASLPNGLYIVTPVSYAFLLTARDEPLTFGSNKDENYTAVNYLFLIYATAGNVSYPGYNRTSDTKPWQFRAIEVLIHACVNTYQTNFTLGQSTTDVVSSSSIPLRNPDNKPLYNVNCSVVPAIAECDPIDIDPTAFTYLQDPNAPDDPEKYYSIALDLAVYLSTGIYQSIISHYFYDGLEDAFLSMNRNMASTVISQVIYGYDSEIENRTTQFQRLTRYFNSHATGLSNMLRTAENDSSVIQGTVLAEETFVHIKWGWAAFLAVQMVFSYLFLAITICRTSQIGVPVLKSSPLATLLVISDEVRLAVGKIGNLSDAEKKSKSIRVRLDGDRIVLA